MGSSRELKSLIRDAAHFADLNKAFGHPHAPQKPWGIRSRFCPRITLTDSRWPKGDSKATIHIGGVLLLHASKGAFIAL